MHLTLNSWVKYVNTCFKVVTFNLMHINNLDGCLCIFVVHVKLKARSDFINVISGILWGLITIFS